MNSNQHRFAMFVDVHGANSVVIGGGPVALRKTRRLLDAGATVRVIAPKVHDEFNDLSKEGSLTIEQRHFVKTDLNDTRIVIAATNDLATNQDIAREAKSLGAYVNVANDPSAGSFIMPSLIDRSPLLIAISSGGASPVLARLLSARIEAFIPQRFSKLADLAGQYRNQIKSTIEGWRERRRFWEQQLGGQVGELVLQGREKEAVNALEEAINEHKSNQTEGNRTAGSQERGEVYLVGAGPGDPDLLTFRALRLMQHVDVVFHDRLVSDAVLALAKPDAERIYVGKQRANHAVPQETINQQLIDHAKMGKRVLRLKGGDPFIFGRGGEEIEQLVEHGIAFQVVPGITAASGSASYAGIPLTHRDHSQACLFVTGHLKNNTIDLNWTSLTQPNQTVIVYMGLVGLPHITKKLMEHGMSATTPIALVSRATTHLQSVIVGTLENIVEQVNNSDIKAPTLIIIGDVVKLRDKLNWFR